MVFFNKLLEDIATIMGYHVERGLRKFADVSKQVVNELGDWVQPYLETAWRMMTDVAWERAVEAIRRGADDKTVRDKMGMFRKVSDERSEIITAGRLLDGPQKKSTMQFYILLAAAAWISIGGIITLSAPTVTSSTDLFYSLWLVLGSAGPWFSFFTLSLPAILFGGVLFWWYGKDMKE